MNRRQGLILGSAVLILPVGLAGCGTPAPPPRFYQLRAQPPVPVKPVASNGLVLQLLLPVGLPEWLDRDALQLPQGEAGLQALTGHHWAEPLRDALPRLLQQDLSALLGDGRVWAAPLPTGLVPTRQLRVAILTLQTRADATAVDLQARCTLSDPSGRSAPLVVTRNFSAPTSGPGPDAWVVAHRLVLWQLAEALAQWVALPRAQG